MEKKRYYEQNFVSHPSLKEPYPVPHSVTQARFDAALSFTPSAYDIYLCSYPKSGSTWISNALMLMRDNGVPMQKGSSLQDKVPFIEFQGVGAVDKIEERPRIIKTHLLFKFTPMNRDTKYIYLARNPKDCVTSYYFHKRGFTEYQFSDGKFDDFFEMFISGKTEFGDYFELVGEWFEESKKRPNICFVLYEAMKQDFEGEFLRIAEFLGKEWKEKLLRHERTILNKVIEHSSFKNMEENCEIYTPQVETKNLKFIRKGEVGDWKNYLDVEQSQMVNERLKEVGKKFQGFDKIWDKYRCL